MNIRTPALRLGVPLVAAAALTLSTLVAAHGRAPVPGPGDAATPPAPQAKEMLGQLSSAFESAAAQVNRSVVPIFSEQLPSASQDGPGMGGPSGNASGEDFLRRFFGGQIPGTGGRERARGLGSGVIVSPDGYILTNNHVVDGADRVTVMLEDKKKYEATIVGRDPQTDLAVVKIDAKDLPAASFGNSDSVRVGEWVIAVGNPFQLMHTVTAGIVSATGRSSMQLADYEDFIQTDASINPGNSGGALADLDGNVVGINTAIVNPSGTAGNIGIGFAIPINMARGVMQKLIANGEVSRGFLGLVPQDIDEDLASALRLGSTSGALVADVSPSGPAASAGVKGGDIILAFNGRPVGDAAGLRTIVADAAPGSAAQLTVLRDGKSVELPVTLGKKPGSIAESNARTGRKGDKAGDLLGLSVEGLTPQLASELQAGSESGVVVAAVKPGGPADEAGVREGDVIREVNRKPVTSPEEFSGALSGVKKGESLALLVSRGGASFFVGLKAAA
jgi:serine protease Do